MSKELSKHLQEQLRFIQRKFHRKWFTADDAIFLSRTDWTIKKLVEAGVVEAKYVGTEKAKSLYHCHIYRAQKCNHTPFSYNDSDKVICLYCKQKLKPLTPQSANKNKER